MISLKSAVCNMFLKDID